MGIALTLHVLAAIVWVGGMFFAWMILRPVSASQLEPPARLTFWLGVFDRFFPWVWAAVVVLMASGFWIVLAVLGGFENAAMHIHVMAGLALVMTAIFLWIYFAPYRQLRDAVGRENWPEGGKALGRIRHLVGVNLVLGLLTAASGSGGRYFIG